MKACLSVVSHVFVVDVSGRGYVGDAGVLVLVGFNNAAI